MTEIVWVDLGLADRIKNEILINEELKKPEHKEILDWILRHEQQHSGTLTMNDIKHDFRFNLNEFKMAFKVFKFQLKHPKTWAQIMPFRYYKEKFYWDMSVIICWVISIGFLITLNWVFYG